MDETPLKLKLTWNLGLHFLLYYWLIDWFLGYVNTVSASVAQYIVLWTGREMLCSEQIMTSNWHFNMDVLCSHSLRNKSDKIIGNYAAIRIGYQGSMYLWNVGLLQRKYTALYSRML
jgi:hypothetical protein